MTKAKEIVYRTEQLRVLIRDNFFDEEIDFLGCSEPYVREKIDYLIMYLQELKKHNKRIDKLNSK